MVYRVRSVPIQMERQFLEKKEKSVRKNIKLMSFLFRQASVGELM